MDAADAAGLALHAAGYPASLVVIARFVPVVRERRVRWFAAHQAAVTAICAGWLLRGRPQAVVPNALWLLAATAWYLLASRRRPA